MTEQSPPNDTLALFPYYVYVLVDPSDGQVFYVGKGQGSRMFSHWSEARRAIEKNDAPGSPKSVRLVAIANNGGEPGQLVIGRYETEAEALSVEATLINWVYGVNNLTNISCGFRNEFIRPKGAAGELSGIDIPPLERRADGEFMQEKLSGLSSAGAYDFIRDIIDSLTDAGFAVRDFSAKGDKPYDPGASNGYLGQLIRIEGVDFLIGVTKMLCPSITVATTSTTRDSLTNAKILQDGNELNLGPAKNITVHGVGRYRDFVPKPRFTDRDPEHRIDALRVWLQSLRVVPKFTR